MWQMRKVNTGHHIGKGIGNHSSRSPSNHFLVTIELTAPIFNTVDCRNSAEIISLDAPKWSFIAFCDHFICLKRTVKTSCSNSPRDFAGSGEHHCTFRHIFHSHKTFSSCVVTPISVSSVLHKE